MKNFNSFFNSLVAMPKRLAMVLTVLFTLGVGSMWGATDVSEFTSQAFAGLSNKWTKTSSGTLGYEAARGVQHQTNATTTFTATSFSNVTKVQVWVAKSSKGAGSVKIQENTTAVKTISSFNTSSTEESYTWSTPYTGTLKIVVNATKASIYIKKIVVTTAAAVSTYTVTYDLNGGIGTEPTQAAVAAGGTFTLAASSGFSKEGYSFAGWNDGTNTYNAGATYTMPAKAVTLKAQWTALPKYTVTWNVNGEVYATQVTEGSKPTFPDTPESCDATSNTFYGWATATWDGKINDVSAKTIYTSANDMPAVNGAVTYYAVFATKETSGSGTAGWNTVTSPADLEVGATYAISNEATNGTYLSTWDGGNNFDGSTSTICPLILGGSEGAWTFQIADGSTYNNYYLTATSQSNNRLRAVSVLDEQCQFSISFDNNISNITCTTKTTHNILRYNPNGGSPIFACYSSGQSDVYLQKYSTGSTTTYSDYITTCTTETSISLYPNFGSELPTVITTGASTYEVPPCSFTRTGYTFSHWDTKADDLGSDYDPGDNINLNGTDVNLYAIWTPQTYDITYKDQGDVVFSGTHGGGYPTKHTYGTATTLKSATKSGYNFLGWFTTSDCSSSAITQLGATAYTSNITLYAKWEEIPTTCTITYDAYGGTGTAPTDNDEYTNGEIVTVKGNYGALTKDGYAFTGWNTAADGSGDSYKAGETFNITTNTTLYAQWCEAHWVLVTNTSEIEDDTRIIIAAKDYNVALSTNQKTNNRGQATITKKYNTVTFAADVQTLSLVGLSDNLFALNTGSGYLYAAGSESNNYLKTGVSPGNNDWYITIAGDGTATLNAQGTYTNNQLKYNSTSSLFSCYGSGNTQKDVVIYKEVCKQGSYNVSATLTNASAANNNATTVLATATSLSLNYSAHTGYLLPETITVKMGGVTLVSGTDYTWDKESGELTITVTGFYGDIDVVIEAEEDPCYGFAMSTVTSTSTTNSITLTWTEVAGATGYKVRLDEGEFTTATGLTHTFEGLSPKTTYDWEVQAINGDCQASQIGSITTQKESFTVSWIVNGNTESPYATESVMDGNKITTYPNDPSAPSGCHEKVFVGWTNNPINTPTNETPAILYKQKSDVPAIIGNTTLHAVWADEKTTEGEEVEVETIASVKISDYATANNWSNSTQYTTVNLDKNITAIAGGGASTGKYYISGNTWRFYRSDNGKLTINAANGCTINTIKVTYTVDDSGVLTYNSSNKESGSEISINASSATFGVGNTNSATNGKVFITAISVTYTTTTKGPDVITYSAYTTLCDECTPSTLTLEADNTTADLDINSKATISFSTTGGNGGEITYAASPKTGVTWDNGIATFTKAGDYTITASQEKNGENCPTTSNTVNVTITAIPHLYFVTDPAPITIEFDPVECGGNTRLEDKKSVSVQAYNLAAAVTAQVTGPYKIARTSGATLNEYTTSLTLRNNITDGKINGDDDVIYILSFPPAGSDNATEGTLTFKTTNGNPLTVKLSTPTITCTPRTLTFNDRGIKTTQEYYAGTEVPEPATPTGVCGEYEFDGWASAKVERGSTTYAKVEFPYIMPANNQTVLYAVYRYTEGPTNQYELVTEIESGKDYVIAAYDEPNGDFALTNSESSTNGKFASVKVECDVNYIITTDNADIIWTVTGNDEDGYKFYNSAVKKYIEMYRSDGKSLLRLVDNCTNTFDVNIEMDENDKVYVDITSPEVDENYNVFSFYQELFNVYTRCDYNIYFYEQTATPFYTTTPDCHPSVTLISDGEVYVTATNGRGIMAATPLTLTTTDLAPNTEIAISSNSNDIYFSTERNTNFAMAQASQPKTSLTLPTNEGGELETQLYIHYKPSVDGDGTPAEVVVTADVSTHNPPFTAQKTIHVRNLPAKFVIATKAGATWYALPANMNGATNPAAVVIEVDETTMTVTAPNTTPYTLWPVATINGGTDRYKEYGERLRFAAVNNGYKGLWANNADKGTTINNNGAIVARGDNPGAAYEWKVTTTVVDGLWQYTLQTDQANNQKNLCYRMNQENPAWGTYASNEAQYQLYFLPIKAETTPFDYQVVEWYPNKVLIHTTTAFSSLTAKIAGEQVANVQYTAKDANQYEITGLPLMENPAKALTLEFVVADATHTGIHTIPVMLSGGNHSVSTLAIGKGIYNYTDLVVRDGATLTVDGAANTDNTFYDVTIYPTAKISVPEDKQLSVHSLTFFGGIDDIYDGEKYTTNKYGVPQLLLKGTLGKTVTTMDYIMRVNLDQMYQVGVPYNVNLGKITYWDGSAIELGNELYVSAYDGQARANLDMNNTWRWEVNFAEKVLKAGVGYTISAEPQVENDDYSILRMPMESNISSGDTEASKQVPVIAYANQHSVQIAANHKGWNYLSNPYMTAISGGEADSELVLGYLKETGTGPWEWVNDEIRYVTIPHDDGEDYNQKKFSKAVLKPFKSFFVQIATDGELSFALTSRQNAPARYMEVQTEQEVEFEILLSNDKQSDNTGLLIAEQYSPAYEINADLEKMIGSMSVYTIYGGYNLAYNAISPINASEWIPIGYIAPAAGEYTFRLDDIDKIVEQVEHVYLIDYEANNIVDLMDDEYEFTTDKEQNNNRFAINVVLSQDKDNTTTGLDMIQDNNAAPIKFIHQDKMYIYNDGIIYDATGKQVTNINK